MQALGIFLCLIVLLLSGLPVAFSLATLSLFLILLKGISLTVIPHMMYSALDSFVLSALPLYILMATILYRGNVGEILFGALNKAVGRFKGGLGIATVLCCAVFAAIAGTSTAVAITVGIIAIPALRQRGYRREFSVGLIASAGTLGMLIPPSVPMILYATVTQESIGQLFIAGLLPGIVLSFVIVLYIRFIAGKGRMVVEEQKASWADVWAGAKRASLAASLIPFIIGGIYLGIFTPSEAAAVGVVYSFVLCFFVYKTLKLYDFLAILREAMLTSAMLLLIISAAILFGHTITFMRIPHELVDFVVSQELSKWTFIIFLNFLYLFLGCFLEAAAIILITIPIFLPVIKALNIDPIWLCVILVMNIEIAMITPPVGLNLFVLQGIVKDTNMAEIFRGALPFVVLILLVMLMVMAFPPLATWLVTKMG